MPGKSSIRQYAIFTLPVMVLFSVIGFGLATGFFEPDVDIITCDVTITNPRLLGQDVEIVSANCDDKVQRQANRCPVEYQALNMFGDILKGITGQVGGVVATITDDEGTLVMSATGQATTVRTEYVIKEGAEQTHTIGLCYVESPKETYSVTIKALDNKDIQLDSITITNVR